MPMVPIDRNTTSDAIRRQLLDIIAEQYEEGIYKLPPEQQIADRLGVSRNTLRPVLSQMAGEGIILRRHGQGTLLNPEALAVCVNLQEMIDFSMIIERCGHSPSHDIYSLEEMPAGDIAAEKLHIADDAPVFRMEYWLYADGIPAIVAEGWCGRDLFYETPDRDVWENNYAFEILERYAGRKAHSDRGRVESMTTEKMHEVLGHKTKLRCQSVLLLDSIAFDRQGEPLVWGRAYFDTNLIHFDLFRVDHGE